MPNDDLINRKALLENYDLKNATKYGNKTEEQRHNSYSTLMRYEIDDMIMDAPAVDAVEVVRCKDCAHYHDGSCEKIEMIMDGYYSGTFERKQPIDFCSRAEKKGQST